MGGKGKKAVNKPADKHIVDESNVVKKVDQNKEEEMNRLMAGINNIDLDNENFIDTVAFDQSKAILNNAIDDLNHYIKLFQKGDYKAFPVVKLEE
jgi:hypothetical protein